LVIPYLLNLDDFSGVLRKIMACLGKRNVREIKGLDIKLGRKNYENFSAISGRFI
jgi:hypothetical protein